MAQHYGIQDHACIERSMKTIELVDLTHAQLLPGDMVLDTTANISPHHALVISIERRKRGCTVTYFWKNKLHVHNSAGDERIFLVLRDE
jgi:hypothetical protein